MLHREESDQPKGLDDLKLKTNQETNIGDLKFLLVDDSVTMRRIYATSLKCLGFGNFIEATDGEDALEKLNSSNDINFVITDWNMPGILGAELVSLIRNSGNEKLKNLPILIVGIRAMEEETKKALNNGASGYIMKPFTPSTLNEKITEILMKISFNNVSESVIKNTFEVLEEIHPANNPRSILDECH
ncbi:MAG: response regulator [Burkholderiales bacterium]|nr:response regulator [Burkholderiales bacterium]